MRGIVTAWIVLLFTAAPAFAASGSFVLPAAQAFGEPGFHRVVVVDGVLPAAAARRRVTVTLRDAGRPGQRCSQDHPLSGCATVDWSDDTSRPNVPASGVFENSVTMGRVKLYLRQSGALAARPDAFEPG